MIAWELVGAVLGMAGIVLFGSLAMLEVIGEKW